MDRGAWQVTDQSVTQNWAQLSMYAQTKPSFLLNLTLRSKSKSWLFFFLFASLRDLSHPHMTTGKTIALTRRTFVDKVMSLLLNMPSRLVITFLPRSKRLLISWRQSPSAVILEPKKIKSATVSTVSPSIYHKIMGPDAMILVF